MCDSNSQHCITRVVDGDDHDVQLAQLQAVMQRIQTALRAQLCEMPAAECIYLGNALLNLAVNKILCDEGSQRTASILIRLSDAVHTHTTPPDASCAIDLSGLHG